MRSVLLVGLIWFCGISSTIFPYATTSAAAPVFPSIPVNPWEAFLSLSGCHKRDRCLGLSHLKRYLNRFGYLPADSATFNDGFDHALEYALLAYQQNFHLNATGHLDPSTLALMIQPRCGVPDIINGTTVVRGRNLYSFFPGKPTWSSKRRSLTYAFSGSRAPVAPALLSKVFARAFGRWAEVTTLSFSEVRSPYLADITIEFFRGDHGDSEPFDGVLGTLAHAFSPTDGRFHLDAAELWTAAEGDMASSDLSRSSRAIDLESVAVHEIGHLLGLGHSSVEDSIMFPAIRPQSRKVELKGDDIEGIQSLYGDNPNYSATSSAPGRSTNTMTEHSGAGKLAAGGRGSFLSTAVVVILLVVL